MMPHCGDWAAKFQVGGLVYYDQYRVAGRNEYGFYGANAENSTLRDDRTVTGDGYGFVYPLSMLPEERENWPVFSYSFDDGPDEQKKWTPLATEPYRIDGKGTEDGYVVIPLPREVLNEEPASAEGSFYRKIGLRVSVQSGKGGTPDSFGYNAFNPFFACTAMTLNGWDDPLEEEKEILLRTPRQLYWMSRCYDLFHEAVTDCSFRQELDLDYGQYDWSGFYRADTGMISDEQSRPVHYGSWQKNPQLGRLGLFYWEYETGGANDGYHLSFVGMDESKAFGGSTLCTAHATAAAFTNTATATLCRRWTPGAYPASCAGCGAAADRPMRRPPSISAEATTAAPGPRPLRPLAQPRRFLGGGLRQHGPLCGHPADPGGMVGGKDLPPAQFRSGESAGRAEALRLPASPGELRPCDGKRL